KRPMHHFARFQALDGRIGRQPAVGNLVAQGLRILVLGGHGIERIGQPVAFRLAEVVNQQVPRDGGYPGHERTLTRVIGGQGAVHLDKDLLGEVLGVLGIARKAVADVVDAPVVALNDLLPGRGVASNAATDKQSDNLGFFQRYSEERFSNPSLALSSRAKRGICILPRTPTAHARYVSVEQEVPLNHGASDCSRRKAGCEHHANSHQWNGFATVTPKYFWPSLKSSDQMRAQPARSAAATIMPS